MGYTHYFKHGAPTERQWDAFLGDVSKIVNDDPNIEWSAVNHRLLLNGIEEFGYEDLVLGDPEAWTFCKTGNRPYDETVCAVLFSALHHGVIISLTSDGSWAEWQDGRDTYTQATGRKPRKGSL